MTFQIKQHWIALALITITCATVTNAVAGNESSRSVDKQNVSHHHNQGNFRKLLRKLDLTDEQKQQVATRVKAHRQSLSELRQTSREQYQALVETEAFDPQAAQALIAAKAELRQQRRLLQLQLQHDLYQLLTPEQQQKAESIRARWQNKKRPQHSE